MGGCARRRAGSGIWPTRVNSPGWRGRARGTGWMCDRTCRRGRDTGDGEFTGGLDVFKNLTPNLNASITVNTDFAETEADIRQVNLTRFPLFFPGETDVLP